MTVLALGNDHICSQTIDNYIERKLFRFDVFNGLLLRNLPALPVWAYAANVEDMLVGVQAVTLVDTHYTNWVCHFSPLTSGGVRPPTGQAQANENATAISCEEMQWRRRMAFLTTPVNVGIIKL